MVAEERLSPDPHARRGPPTDGEIGLPVEDALQRGCTVAHEHRQPDVLVATPEQRQQWRHHELRRHRDRRDRQPALLPRPLTNPFPKRIGQPHDLPDIRLVDPAALLTLRHETPRRSTTALVSHGG